jgi:histidine triad (HIT) family protein
MASDCIFCKIIAHQLPADIIAENEAVLVIKDIHPKAPTHLLIIPKKHLEDLRDAEAVDAGLLANILFMSQELSQKIEAPGAFRLLFNNGPEVGQKVFHMHAHFLAGKQLFDF